MRSKTIDDHNKVCNTRTESRSNVLKAKLVEPNTPEGHKGHELWGTPSFKPNGASTIQLRGYLASTVSEPKDFSGTITDVQQQLLCGCSPLGSNNWSFKVETKHNFHLWPLIATWLANIHNQDLLTWTCSFIMIDCKANISLHLGAFLWIRKISSLLPYQQFPKWPVLWCQIWNEGYQGGPF